MNETFGLQKVEDVIALSLHRFPVLLHSLALGELEVVGYQPLQALKRPQEDARRFRFHLHGQIGIIRPVLRLFFGSQHQLPAVKAVAVVVECVQIAVTEGHKPGKHPSLMALLALAFQIHLPLCRHDGLHIVGLAKGFHLHVIIHTQQDVFQISTGKTVLGDFADAAILHIGAKDATQHSADLRLAFAAVALDDHHPLSLVGGDQAVADELLQRGNVFFVEQSVQKFQPQVRGWCVRLIRHRQTASHDLRLPFCEGSVQQQRTVGNVDAIRLRWKILHLSLQLQYLHNVANPFGKAGLHASTQLVVDLPPKRQGVGYPAVRREKSPVCEEHLVFSQELFTKQGFVDGLAVEPDRIFSCLQALLHRQLPPLTLSEDETPHAQWFHLQSGW